ncbi:MAG: FlgK family flagellar hook-associated protein, partial [Phenylobacterium sp.]
MSLTSVLSNATSGMIAAQASLRTTSDNVANVNTPGYVRKQVDQAHRVVGGVGAGVEISDVRRVIDQFLVSAGLTANSTASRWNLISTNLDTAQSLFGDPTSQTGYFATLDKVWDAFGATAANPTSGVLRSESVAAVKTFFDQTAKINAELKRMAASADDRAQSTTRDINDLLAQISKLNTDISRTSIGSGDSTGAENVQMGLIEKLATLIDIQVQPRSAGGYTLRTAEGFELVGDAAVTVAYRSPASTPATFLSTLNPPLGAFGTATLTTRALTLTTAGTATAAGVAIDEGTS